MWRKPSSKLENWKRNGLVSVHADHMHVGFMGKQEFKTLMETLEGFARTLGGHVRKQKWAQEYALSSRC